MNIKSPYIQGQEVQQNTSPASPPVPQQAGTGQHGIETQRPRIIYHQPDMIFL
jgi:hypothetical protein